MREAVAFQTLTRPQQSTGRVAPAPWLPVSARPCSPLTLTPCAPRTRQQAGKAGWVLRAGCRGMGQGIHSWGWSSLSHLPTPPPGQQGHQKTGPVLLNPGIQRGWRVGDKRGNLEGKPKQAMAGGPPGPSPPNRVPACSGARALLLLVFGVTLGFPRSWAGLGLYSHGFFWCPQTACGQPQTCQPWWACLHHGNWQMPQTARPSFLFGKAYCETSAITCLPLARWVSA